MTQQQGDTGNRHVTASRGKPFLPGNNANPNGRPRKGNAIRDLLKKVPVSQKRALIQVAYEEALKGDHHWAEWIARHSGESGSGETDGNGLMRELIIREYSGWPEAIE